MGLRRAQRQKTKLKIGLTGTAGSGKSYSALLLAKGLVGSLSKVCVLDTENGSANIYSHLGEYFVQPFEPPFDPKRYCSAIDYILKEAPDVECIIIDSISHEWSGPGGCLELQQNLGGRFQDWKDVTRWHNQFLEKILQCPVHVIATMRSKQDHVIEDVGGKKVVKKLGLGAVQREGTEYEMSLVLDVNQEHFARSSKDRTGLFVDKPPFIINEETGLMLKNWADGK